MSFIPFIVERQLDYPLGTEGLEIKGAFVGDYLQRRTNTRLVLWWVSRMFFERHTGKRL